MGYGMVFQKPNQLYLCLLTSWHLTLGDRPIDLKGQKYRALLSYLTLETERSIHRDELAALLWPGGDRKKSRASLRQSLSRLGKLLGGRAIASDGPFLSSPKSAIWTDVDQLKADLEEGQITRTTLNALRGVPEILRGYEGIGEEFDDWLREARARVVSDAMTRAEALLQGTALDAETQLKLARVVLEIDNLNEIAARGQISALAALNDNSAALRVYNAFYQRLEDELGAEPSVETQDLAVRIKLSAAPEEDAPARVATPKLAMGTLVAVLPFERLGPTDLPDYAVLGMLDQITCRMAACQAPPVISSNSTRQYLNQTPNVVDVGVALDAAYVVSGTIRTARDRALVSVQLCEGASGRLLWANSREVPLDQLFDVSSEIASDIACMIEPSLNLAEMDRARDLPSQSLEPHHLVLQAKELMFKLNPDDFRAAKAALDKALQMKPNFAPAHALLAEWHGLDLWQGWSGDPEASRSAIHQHSEKAVQLFPNNGRALAQWGHHQITLYRDFDAALQLFDTALEYWPYDAETLIWTVPTLAHAGLAERALENGLRAFRLSPFDPFLHRYEHFLSLAHYACGQFEEAARLGFSSFNGRPNYGSNLRVTMAALVGAGRVAEARELSRHHAEAEPGFALGKMRDKMGFRAPDAQERYVQHLIAAGVPL